MTLNKDDYSFILALKGVYHITSAKKSDLQKLVIDNGGITATEDLMLEEFNRDILPPGPFSSYKTVTDMRIAIETHAQQTIYYRPSGKNSHGKLLTFCKMTGVPYEIPKIEFTEEQEKILNSTGIQAVNAGPGTGKTTVANEKAYRLREDGVLLFSYTNAAILENYKRLRVYPMDKDLGKKNVKKQINITTVDSLATAIVGVHDNHDHTIMKAIEALENGYVPNTLRKYRHIIVDETQDIDEIRGKLIMLLYRMLNCKSITLFGDPRQQLDSNKGKWYINLCKNAINLSFSHRFENKRTLNLCNALSSTRPEIHHDLVLYDDPECKDQEVYPIKEITVEALLKFVQEKVQDGYTYSDFAVVGPSVTKDNISSRSMKQLVAVFKENDIPCYMSTDSSDPGTFVCRGIQFTTIHSVKGKEFKFVIAVGISDYHNRYNMIARESMDSLIFVMHTRAKEQMFYLQDKDRILPRGVPEHMYEGTFDQSKEYKEWKIEMLPVKNTVNDHTWGRFADTNGVTIRNTKSVGLDNTIPKAPKNWSPVLWGTLVGMAIEICAVGEYPKSIKQYLDGKVMTLTEYQYKEKLRMGQIVDGRYVDSGQIVVRTDLVNIPREEEKTQARDAIQKPIEDLTNEDIVAILRIYDYIHSDNMLSRYDTSHDFKFNLIHLCSAVAEELVDAYGEMRSEVKIANDEYIGFADLVSNTHIIELKTGQYSKEQGFQAALYEHIMNDDMITLVIDVCSGTTYTIESDLDQAQWEYFLKCYYTIFVHNFYVMQRLNKKDMIAQKLPDNYYIVDTEFDTNQNNEIFELAAVNYNDPFRTFCKTLNIPNTDFACAWSRYPKQLFDSSPRLNEAKQLFDKTRFTDTPKILYYTCAVDYTWYPKAERLDLGPIARRKAEKLGAFVSGYSAPKLGEFYDVCSDALLEFQPHLKAHTALSDALMLWELLMLNKLEL